MPARMPRGVSLAILVAMVAGGIWAVRSQPVTIDAANAERSNFEATVTAEGKTRVKELFTIGAPVDGELERIAFKAGDVVSLSSPVARIWPAPSRPLDPRSRAEATAAVTAARAAVQRAEAAEREARAALEHAESAFRTSTQLAKQGVVASKEAEHAGHQVDIRRQALEATQSAVAQARAELVRAEAAVAVPVAGSGQRATEVRSPTAGRVLRVLRESAGPVAAGTPLLHVGDTNALEVVADFLTTDAMAIEPGAAASILDWGGSQPLVARVRHVDPGAFTKVSALGLEEQRVPVVLDLVGRQAPGFGHDFHVNVAVVVWRGTNVLTVPLTALFRVGESWAVFVVRDGRARLTRVRPGRSDVRRTVIEQGLAEGDEVAVQPSDTVRDGSRVNVR